MSNSLGRRFFVLVAALTVALPLPAGQHQEESSFSEASRHHQATMEGFYGVYGVGYVFDFLKATSLRGAAGVFGSLHFFAEPLVELYGERATSYGFYLRLKM